MHGRRCIGAAAAANQHPDLPHAGAKLDLSDPAGTVIYGGRLPSRRRATVGGLTALGIGALAAAGHPTHGGGPAPVLIHTATARLASAYAPPSPLTHLPPSTACTALGGNLGGVTSGLLSLDDGQLAAQLRLDVLIPVQGFKRCVDYQNAYGEGSLAPSAQQRACALPWWAAARRLPPARARRVPVPRHLAGRPDAAVSAGAASRRGAGVGPAGTAARPRQAAQCGGAVSRLWPARQQVGCCGAATPHAPAFRNPGCIARHPWRPVGLLAA